jgi:hypothetical protein
VNIEIYLRSEKIFERYFLCSGKNDNLVSAILSLPQGCKRDQPEFLSPSPFWPSFYLNLRKKGMETHLKAILITTLASPVSVSPFENWRPNIAE